MRTIILTFGIATLEMLPWLQMPDIADVMYEFHGAWHCHAPTEEIEIRESNPYSATPDALPLART
ncbi:hypothetical protein H6F95_16740 [Cyanobacteria bacterium FACHB-471]|nr:hypothetical protein [Cyanobacteria bacterium FACHB-471]